MLVEKYLDRVNNIHNNSYEYYFDTLEVFAKDLVVACCPTHGIFKTRMHDHLYHKSKCPKCSNENKTHKKTFIKNAKEKFGSKYNYIKTNYINAYTPVQIICDVHGIFDQLPYIHLGSKFGCPKCANIARRGNFENFVNRANAIHNNVYGYNNAKYVDSNTKIKITCGTHGDFLQIPKNHIFCKSGCPSCANNNRSITHNLNNKKDSPKPNDVAILYLAKFELCDETFLKIGLTTNAGIGKRFGKTHRGYKIKKIYEQEMTIKEVTKIENNIIDIFHENKYIPQIKFGGYTECFDISILDEIVTFIKEAR